MNTNNKEFKNMEFTPCQSHKHLDCVNGIWFDECPDCWTEVKPAEEEAEE